MSNPAIPNNPFRAADRIGCDQCWPASVTDAWERKHMLKRIATLIDESHYSVRISMCPDCSQQFLTIFTEWIDWVGGNDPQYWTVYPLTVQEAQVLHTRGEHVTEQELNALPTERQCLQRDFPSNGPTRVQWGRGVFVGPHD